MKSGTIVGTKDEAYLAASVERQHLPKPRFDQYICRSRGYFRTAPLAWISEPTHS